MYKAYLTENDDGSAQPVLLKHRFPKKYRHPGLSTQLTRTRITSEARSLARCARGGVRVPQVVLVEVESGIIGIEWIDGKSVRSVLGADEEDMAHNSCIVAVAVAGAEAGAGEGYMEAHLHDTRGHEAKAGGGGGGRGEPKLSDAARYGISQGGFTFIFHPSSFIHPHSFLVIVIVICHCHLSLPLSRLALSPTEMLMQLIGRELGRMHRADIIHGDLTTSNMLVRRTTTSTTSTTSTMPTATTSGVGADTEIVSGHPRPSPGQVSH